MKSVAKKIVLIVKNNAKAKKKAVELRKWLIEKGVLVLDAKNSENDFKDIFCVFVLGGDGTFLRAARWIGKRQIPVIGIKFGGIGFLTNILENKIFDAAQKILDGDFKIEKRIRLNVRVFKSGKKIIDEDTLNDAVINRNYLSRIVNLNTFVDDNYVTTYRCDGLVIASPTGSTAYSLAAGGPIVHPLLSSIIISPICPFTLTNRPLVLSDKAQIRINFSEKYTNLMLSLDGRKGIRLCVEDEIIITKSKNLVSVITLEDYNYFEVLKTKLRWSGGKF